MVTTDANGNLSTADVPVSSPWQTNGANIIYYKSNPLSTNGLNEDPNSFGKIGIGTDNPQKAIHIRSQHICADRPPHCEDGVQNADETGVDCGGANCPPCGGTQSSHGGIRFEVNDGLCPGSAGTGMWDIEPHSNLLNFALNGASIMSLSSSGVTFSGPQWSSDGTNLFYDGGNVGIGTTAPGAKLHVNGKVRASAFASNSPLIFEVPIGTERARIDDVTGNMGIGKTPDVGYKLDVNGAIRATLNAGEKFEILDRDNKKIFSVDESTQRTFMRGYTITPDAFYDFVFDEDYKLMSLLELEKFVKKHKHLPDIPSEEEIKKNGMDGGEMIGRNTQKIEELFLHAIEMKKEIIELKRENAELKRQMKSLKK